MIPLFLSDPTFEGGPKNTKLPEIQIDSINLYEHLENTQKPSKGGENIYSRKNILMVKLNCTTLKMMYNNQKTYIKLPRIVHELEKQMALFEESLM